MYIIVNTEKIVKFLRFVNIIKRYEFNVENLRLGPDLSISVNSRVISPFRKVFG